MAWWASVDTWISFISHSALVLATDTHKTIKVEQNNQCKQGYCGGLGICYKELFFKYVQQHMILWSILVLSWKMEPNKNWTIQQLIIWIALNLKPRHHCIKLLSQRFYQSKIIHLWHQTNYWAPTCPSHKLLFTKHFRLRH